MQRLHVFHRRGIIPIGAWVLAVAGWATGCATPQPLMEPAFAQRTYTPARIGLLPPDIFVVYDQAGSNDPVRSAALGQAVTQETMNLVAQALQQRGYNVDLSARWDGIHGQDGQLLVNRDELGWFANSILQFSNSAAGGAKGPLGQPIFIAPELAQKLGWATQSDALMYLNIKGIAVSPGKRAAQVAAVALFVVVIAAIILIAMTEGKNNGGSGSRGGGSGGATNAFRGGGGGSRSVSAAPIHGGVPNPGGVRAAPPISSGPPRGYGGGMRGGGGGPVYHGGGGGGSHVSVGVGFVVPLDGPSHTHDGRVNEDEGIFDGDNFNIAMTLVSAQDGRVLWHLRDNFDVRADDPQDVARFVYRVVGMIPPSLAPGAPGPINPTSPQAAPAVSTAPYAPPPPPAPNPAGAPKSTPR